MQSYQLGNQLVLATTFYDAATRLPVNPDLVILKVMDPGGNPTTVAASNTAQGVYKALFTPTVAGVWTVRWSGSGTVVAADEYQFEITPSAFGSTP